MHDKIIIFARFTNTQKVRKPEVVPLCNKWMSRGDGLEIDSAISSTALSLHYLHFCKIWRYFIQFNYHSGSVHEAISTSSTNASQSLPSTTTPSPAISESSSENPVKTGSSKLPKLYSFLYNSFNVATNSFFLIVLSGFYLACKRYAFFALKWETSSQTSKPSAPLCCTLRTFLMSHHFPIPFTRSSSVFSPHLLPVKHSNLAAASTSKSLFAFRLFGFSSGHLRSWHNPTGSSRDRSDGPNNTHWCCQVFWRHFYRVFDLSTINVVPV